MIGLPHSTAPCLILIMPSTRLGSDKYTFLSHGLTRQWYKPRQWYKSIYQNGRQTLNPFSHHVISKVWVCDVLICYNNTHYLYVIYNALCEYKNVEGNCFLILFITIILILISIQLFYFNSLQGMFTIHCSDGVNAQKFFTDKGSQKSNAYLAGLHMNMACVDTIVKNHRQLNNRGWGHSSVG